MRQRTDDESNIAYVGLVKGERLAMNAPGAHRFPKTDHSEQVRNMKRITLSTLAGLALLVLLPVAAQARVNVNLDLGVPLYVEPSREYYAPPPPVYYGPAVIYHEGYRDHGWDHRREHGHRGHHR